MPAHRRIHTLRNAAHLLAPVRPSPPEHGLSGDIPGEEEAAALPTAQGPARAATVGQAASLGTKGNT